MDIERHNHRQIEQLNQRGGRTLSIVDLIQAGTINVEMAAYAMRAMAEGASLLTAARPGGAGKTALMAAILGLPATRRADRHGRWFPRYPRGAETSGGRTSVLPGPRDRRR